MIAVPSVEPSWRTGVAHARRLTRLLHRDRRERQVVDLREHDAQADALQDQAGGEIRTRSR